MIFPTFPGTNIKYKDESRNVIIMQDSLNIIFDRYPFSNKIYDEPYFGDNTYKAVICIQKNMGIKTTGIIDEKTWYAIIALSNFISVS